MKIYIYLLFSVLALALLTIGCKEEDIQPEMEDIQNETVQHDEEIETLSIEYIISSISESIILNQKTIPTYISADFEFRMAEIDSNSNEIEVNTKSPYSTKTSKLSKKNKLNVVEKNDITLVKNLVHLYNTKRYIEEDLPFLLESISKQNYNQYKYIKVLFDSKCNESEL